MPRSHFANIITREGKKSPPPQIHYAIDDEKYKSSCGILRDNKLIIMLSGRWDHVTCPLCIDIRNERR